MANGGIRTHPDTGRAKLNLDAMTSSLAVLDTADGGLVRSQSLGERLRRLSIRHLDIDRDFRIVVAMQHEGSRRDRVPLVAFERDAGLVPAYASAEVNRQDAPVLGFGLLRRLRALRRGFPPARRHRESCGRLAPPDGSR